MKQLLLTIVFLCGSFATFAQIKHPFKLKGNAIALGKDRAFQLTGDLPSQAGAIWSEKIINLSQSFEIIATVNLGTRNGNGADGLAFILSDNNDFLDNTAGSHLGVQGLNPCLLVEMDTYQTGSFLDPSADHLALIKNGNLNHASGNTLAGPVQAGATTNIEDGNDHTFRFVWNASTQTITVFFDCVQKLSYNNDVVKNIFNGKNQLYFGFSAATGQNFNKHTVAINRVSAWDSYQEKTLCLGDAVQLSASYGFLGTWKPFVGLSDMNSNEPLCFTSETNTYFKTTTMNCNTTFTDTIKVVVPQLIPKSFPNDTAICDAQQLIVNASAPDASLFLWNNGSEDSIVSLTKSGFYKVEISNGACVFRDSFSLVVHPTPVISLGKDTTFCNNKNITLDATNALAAIYSWKNGSSNPTFEVNQTGEYWVKVITANACVASDTVKIITKPTYSISQTVKICAGETYTFAGKEYSKDTTICEIYNAVNTCDSTYCVTLIVKPTPIGSLVKKICKGDVFEFNGEKYFDEGVYDSKLVAANGCDSIVVISLTTIPIDSVTVKEVVCENTNYSIGNQTFFTTGIYTVPLKDKQTACDSIVILDLKVVPLRGFTGKDTICEGENYKFATLTPTKSGVYKDTLKNVNGCDSIVELTLLVLETPKLALTTAQNVLCKIGDETSITATKGFEKYEWSNDKEGSNQLKISDAALYKVTCTAANGCKKQDSIRIFLSPPIDVDFALKTPSCSGYSDGKIEIQAIFGGFSPYAFQIDKTPFDKKEIFDRLKEGTYEVTVRDSAGCLFSQKINLENPVPKSIQIADNQRIIELGDSILVDVLPSFADVASVVWSPMATTSNVSNLMTWLKPVVSNFFKVIVKDSLGCVFSDSIQVIVKDEINLFVPNIFSANNDGTNDGLQAFFGSGVEKIVFFSIFDRWGNKVFEAADLRPSDTISWNGKFRERDLVQGIYTYALKVLKINGKEEVRKGETYLVR